MTSGAESLPDAERPLYERRWIFAAAISCLIALQSYTAQSVNGVNNVFVAYFRTSFAKVDWGSIGATVAVPPAVVLVSWLVYAGRARVKTLCLGGAFVIAAGDICMLLAFTGSHMFPLYVVGQTISGLQHSVTYILVPAFVARWFPKKQVGIGTGVLYVGASFGLFFGCLVPSFVFVQPPAKNSSSFLNESVRESWMLANRDAGFFLYLTPLITAIGIFAMLLIFMTDRPPVLPTLEQENKCQAEDADQGGATLSGYFCEVKSFLTNLAYLNCCVVGGIFHYAGNIEFVMLTDMLRAFFDQTGSKQNPVIMGIFATSIMAVGSVVGTPVASSLANRYHQYYSLVIGGALACFLSSVGVLVSFYLDSIFGVFAFNFFYGAGSRVCTFSVFEIALHLTFPIKSGIVGGFYAAIFSIEIIVIVEIARAIFTGFGVLAVLAFQSSVLLLGFVLACLIKPTNKILERGSVVSDHLAKTETLSLLH